MESKERIKTMKEQVILHPEKVSYISSYEHPATFQEDVAPLSLKTFINNLNINVISSTPEELAMDVIGIDAPLANALRRIMISEVPTMAIEKVTIFQNTSIIADEVLAHRLGLIPILADPSQFVMKDGIQQLNHPIEHSEYNESNSIKMKLKVICKKNEEKMINENVLSGDLQWIPIGAQKEKFSSVPIRPVHSDILIAKLLPGQVFMLLIIFQQEIEAELIIEKGIGQTHAKWSPVATAFYRLMPNITFNQEISGKQALTLKAACPMGVFDIEDVGGKQILKVQNSRNCTSCRECLREHADCLTLGKMKNHFEFHIESVGILSPAEIFLRACQVLKEKSNDWLHLL